MKRPPTIADFQRLTRKLSRLVVARIAEALPANRKQPGWVSGFIEARWCSDTTGPWRTTKLRALPPTGKQLVGMHTTDEMERLLGQLWAMRNVQLPDVWWGLKLTVFPEADPQLELNPDPDCVVDPQWFLT